jgi:predicted PurR-regulated permease PerM
VFILSLVAGCFWILRPFLTGILWAAIIVVATWPLLLRLESCLHGRRWLAVTVMTMALLMVFVLPFSVAIVEIVDRSGDIVSWVGSLSAFTLPQPPEWLRHIPFYGPKLMEHWQTFRTTFCRTFVGWRPMSAAVRLVCRTPAALVRCFSISFLPCHCIFYAHGEKASNAMCRLASRLGGPRGEDAVLLAARAVRGVALGVVVTAVLQSVLGGLGLLITGVPVALLLTGIMFILCTAQIGPLRS